MPQLEREQPALKQMPSASPPPTGPCAMIIFGGTGDLAARKLLPALYNLAKSKLLSPDFADRAPHVLLVPQALDPHGRHGQRLLRHHPDQVLALPEGVVGRVLADLAPGNELIEAVRLRERPGRPEPAGSIS